MANTNVSTTSSENNNTMDDSMREVIEIYGEMISDSLRINNNSLINCLDEILLLLNNYFMLINKVDINRNFIT